MEVDTFIKGVAIYTDWANHYLERGRYKRNIQDLQVDIGDGVLLADVIEAVIGTKVPGISRKPKNSSQMVENITACLAFVSSLGVSVEGVTSKDVKEGNLKVILSLFFNLSRYKQAQKGNATLAPDHAASGGGTAAANGANLALKANMVATSGGQDMLSKLPSPFRQSLSGRTLPSPVVKGDNSVLPSASQNPSNRRIPPNDRNNRLVSPSTVGHATDVFSF